MEAGHPGRQAGLTAIGDRLGISEEAGRTGGTGLPSANYFLFDMLTHCWSWSSLMQKEKKNKAFLWETRNGPPKSLSFSVFDLTADVR